MRYHFLLPVLQETSSTRLRSKASSQPFRPPSSHDGLFPPPGRRIFMRITQQTGRQYSRVACLQAKAEQPVLSIPKTHCVSESALLHYHSETASLSEQTKMGERLPGLRPASRICIQKPCLQWSPGLCRKIRPCSDKPIDRRKT